MDPITQFTVEHVIGGIAGLIVPLMLTAFIIGIVVRVLIYYTARAEHRIAKEFEKRAHYFLTENPNRTQSFHRSVRYLLLKTLYEVFEYRRIYKRRNLDHVMTLTDRLFLIQDGVIRLAQDTLGRTRYLKREGQTPRMLDLTRSSFEGNPIFTRIFAIFPTNLLNELVNIMPSLLIIGGIFGTFLGIAKSIPELGAIDLAQAEQSKAVMDAFLVTISQAMVKSIIGIGLSVLMSLVNTVLSPDQLYYDSINRFSNTLERVWYETTTNQSDLSDIEIQSIDKTPEIPIDSLQDDNDLTSSTPLKLVG